MRLPGALQSGYRNLKVKSFHSILVISISRTLPLKIKLKLFGKGVCSIFVGAASGVA